MGQRKTWSAEEKLQIIKEAETDGAAEVVRKREISLATFYKWKKIHEQHGLDGLKSQKQRQDPALKKLQFENERLKKLLAEKELALSIQSDLLKKSTLKK
jgi:transposase-like protein